MLKRINIKTHTGSMPKVAAVVKTPLGYDLWTGREFFGGMERTRWGWNVWTPASPIECTETFKGALVIAEDRLRHAIGG